MLDIPELEAFDRVIWANSWLDESTGELMAWSRGQYDDFRRKHPECGLPTSTDALRYFGKSTDRFGWTEIMGRRFDLCTPERQGTEFEWGRHKPDGFYGEFNGDDEVVDDPFPDNIEDKSIAGWEDRVINEIDAEIALSLLISSEHICPGGSDCCLSNEVKHELCICQDEHCECHSKERYQPRKARNPFAGVAMFTPPQHYRVKA